MSRPLTSINNTDKHSAIIQAQENERLEYLAVLLLDIIDEELQEIGVDACTLN